MGAVQDVVAPAAADARHDVLIAKVGRQTTLRRTGANEPGELFAPPVPGPSPASGPSSSAASTHHEAFRWVPYSRTEDADFRLLYSDSEHEAHGRAAGPSLLRRHLDIKASRLREV